LTRGGARRFIAVPRELFVPHFFAPDRDRPGWRSVKGDDEWRTALYTDTVLVTQLGGDDRAADAIRRGEPVYALPTSSSSAPSLMAAMLEALAIGDDMRVLEIGTGTGYNAALLSHRLGAVNVTTVEVDAVLSARARTALATAGYEPTLVVGDGAAGYEPNAPYDRVLATVAVPAVPAAWVEQTQVDALLLVPLTFAGRGGLMALLQRTPTGATGRFLGQYGGFMSVRGVPPESASKADAELLGTPRPTDMPVEVVTDRHPASFFVSLSCPPFRTMTLFPDDGAPAQTWCHGDGSEFVLVADDGRVTVAADGPLWDKVEAAYQLWNELDQPARESFGLTVEPDRQWVWLSEPGSAQSWPVPL
jgi:protein-L-isoaspartate O-methyltransferase